MNQPRVLTKSEEKMARKAVASAIRGMAASVESGDLPLPDHLVVLFATEDDSNVEMDVVSGCATPFILRGVLQTALFNLSIPGDDKPLAEYPVEPEDPK